MPENQSEINKLANRQKLAIFTDEGGPALYKMIKDGEEFYFDSTDLPERQPEFDEMGENGWILVEREEVLPAYLYARQHFLEETGFVSSGWGYKKK